MWHFLEPYNQTEDSAIDDYEEASNENKSEEESSEIEDIGKIEDKQDTEEQEVDKNSDLAGMTNNKKSIFLTLF